jgi:hypothetical protein
MSNNDAGIATKASDSISEGTGPYGIKVAGNSMAPRCCGGDIVLFDPALPPKADRDAIFYQATKNESGDKQCAIRRLVSFTDTTWTVMMFNPPETLEYDRAEWPTCHRVTYIIPEGNPTGLALAAVQLGLTL